MNKYLLLLVLVLIGGASYSQTIAGPNVIFPSPNAATLQRFGDYPVSHSTGLAQISIPLYTIKLRDYSFPISIDNHASGIMAGNNYSPLGIGWALTATGYISREIHGRPDEDYPALEITKTAIDSLYTPTITTTGGTYSRLLLDDTDIPLGSNNGYSGVYGPGTPEDPEHDIFSFNVNGISGKFIVNSGGTDVQLLSPSSDIKITGNIGVVNSGGFTITDTKGIQYSFGHVYAGGVTYGAVETVKIGVQAVGFTTNKYVNSSWFLAQIITPSGETVNFTYDNRQSDDAGIHAGDSIQGSSSPATQVTYGYANNFVGGVTPTGSELSDYYYNSGIGHYGMNTTTVYNGNEYTISFLTGITFNTGSVAFTYDDSSLSLSSYQVKDNNNVQVKGAAFSYFRSSASSYNNNNAMLTTLNMQGAAGAPAEVYSFTYWNPSAAGSSVGKDWWGYANGQSSLGPPTDPAGSPYYTGCGCRNPSGSKDGMLKKITYPTGGNTQFDYEPNYYEGVGGAHEMGPGLRILSIIADDGSGSNMVTKTYKYGSSEDGFGTIVRIPDGSDFYTEQQFHAVDNTPNYYGNYTLRTYRVDPVDGMTEAYRQPIYYGTVAEYTTAQDASNNGKIVYSYTTPGFSNDYTIPKTFRIKAWTGGKLLSKTVYKYQGGSYVQTESSSTSYGTYRYTQIPQLKIYRNIMMAFEDSESISAGRPLELAMQISTVGGHTIPNPYFYKDNPIESAVELPEFETHTTFNSAGDAAVSTNTHYLYNSANHLQPIKIVTLTSRGDSLITENIYPRDFDNTNIVVENPLESRTYREDAGGGNKRLLSSTYTVWHSPNVPDSVYAVEAATPLTSFNNFHFDMSGSPVIDSHYVKKQVFNYNSNLNVEEQHAVNNIHTCYIWGYGREYPVAKIENASYAAVQAVLGSTNITTFENNLTPTASQVNTFLAPLRTDPSLSAAQLTTYTYAPMIGMTSMTDPKGETTYYEYDSSNRLSLIVDHNANVAKAFCYNYQGQANGCPIAQIVYARLEFTNYQNTTDPEIGPDYDYEQYLTTADAIIHFYADAACTIPKAIPAALTATVVWSETDSSHGGVINTNYDYAIPANVSSYPIGTGMEYSYNSSYDDYTTGITTYYNQNYTYYTATHTGSNYTPAATVY